MHAAGTSMSGPTTRMMQVVALTFCLCLVNGISSPKTIPDTSITGVSFEDHLNGGHATLNEMFREVEMLMEDTQHVLEEAVDQVNVPFCYM